MLRKAIQTIREGKKDQQGQITVRGLEDILFHHIVNNFDLNLMDLTKECTVQSKEHGANMLRTCCQADSHRCR